MDELDLKPRDIETGSLSPHGCDEETKMQKTSGDHCRLWHKTVVLFVRFFSMGMGLTLLGPTLVSMEVLHNTDTAGIAWALSTMRIGGILGAMLCWLLYDRIHPDIFQGLGILLAAVAMATAPFTGYLAGFLSLVAVMGLGIGVVDSGSLPYLMTLWEGSKSRDTIVYVLAFVFTLAQFTTTLCVRNLLHIAQDTTDDFSCGHLTNNRSHNTTEPLNIDQPNQHVNMAGLPVESYNTSDVGPDNDVTRSAYAYLVVACLPLLAALLSFVNVIIYVWCKKSDNKNNENGKEEKLKREQKKKQYGRDEGLVLDDVILLTLFCLYMLVYNWVESIPGAFLSSFTIKGLCKDVKTGSDVTTAYYGSAGAARVVAIIASRWLKPETTLYFLFVCYGAGMGLGFLIPVAPELIWVIAPLCGVGASSMQFASILWFTRYRAITGKLSALRIISVYIGGVTGPVVVGRMFQDRGHMWVIYISFSALIGQVVLFAAIEVFARVKKLGKDVKGDVGVDAKKDELKHLKHAQRNDSDKIA